MKGCKQRKLTTGPLATDSIFFLQTRAAHCEGFASNVRRQFT
jgi:hypothetical protein